MLFGDGSFGHDWTLHLWLVRQQQWNIEAMGHPGLFVSVAHLGLFYPVYAFVGSGMYTLGGILAIVLGDRPILAYKLLYLGGLCLAYGGMTWLSVQVGLRRWRSQIPGLVLVTGAYFVTDMAGRGDFGEYVALASIPFLIAALCAVWNTPVVRVRNVFAVVVGTFVFTGSHNITLLWGTVFTGLLGALALIAFVGSTRIAIEPRRLGALALGAAIGTGLNAWFLLPDLAFGLDSFGVKQSQGVPPPVRFTEADRLLNPLRLSAAAPRIYGDVRLTLPWLFATWAVVVGIAFWRGRRRPDRTFVVGLTVLAGVFLTLVLSEGLWTFVPSVLYNLQFTWRLHAYVLLATALLVMVVLRWHSTSRDPARKVATSVLLSLVAFNFGGAVWQIARVRPVAVESGQVVFTDDRFVDTVVAARTTAPASWYAIGQFRDGSAPVVATERDRVVDFPVPSVNHDRFRGSVRVPDGPAPFRTNISAGDYFLHVEGIRPVGRTKDGLIVAVRAAGAPVAGPVFVTIRPARSMVFTVATGLSILALIALGALGSWPLRRRLPRRVRDLRRTRVVQDETVTSGERSRLT